VFAVYTQNSGQNAPLATAVQYIEPYIDGGYWTGFRPMMYQFTPFTAVIDMENGEVLAVDTMTSQLGTAQITNLVQAANED
jgi:hypothetical protein